MPSINITEAEKTKWKLYKTKENHSSIILSINQLK
jgi:hypothetical protein